MDQDNTKGQDKRNWRERLGIGAPAAPHGLGAGQRDLPRISDDVRAAPPAANSRPVASARPATPLSRATPQPATRAPAAPRPASAVKPAPMAPRASAPMAPRANPKPQPPVAPDKLAERLRSQRDASTKMAEQRVQVARQRGDVSQISAPPPPMPAAPVQAGPRPKFTFAEDGENRAGPLPVPPPPRPAMPPPPPPFVPANPAANSQPLAPARPPLGVNGQAGAPGFQPRPINNPFQNPPPQTGFQQNGLPPGYPPAYGQQPMPPYRPIDPATGYAPPPGYNPPPRNFTAAPGPRLNMPPRPTPGLNANYQAPQADFGPASAQPSFAPPPRNARPAMRGPVAEPAYEDDGYVEAAAPAPRMAARPTSTDYQQAYREAEYGYEDEAPRSKAPWILAGLLLLAMLVAAAGVYAYNKYGKQFISGQTTEQTPTVKPPDAPAKLPPEQPATATNNGTGTPNPTPGPTKKQIYDRIVGDKEVIGGELAAPPEVPAAVPDPAPAATGTGAQPATNGGDDAAPLPIPPPPGGAGGQQGELTPPADINQPAQQTTDNITPAAGDSQAAVAIPGAGSTPSAVDPPASETAVANSAPPAPGEIDSAATTTRSLASNTPDAGAEKITDGTEKIVTLTKKAEKKKPAPTKDKQALTNLGSKPVVLVPPSKPVKAQSKPKAVENVATTAPLDNSGGLFGDAPAGAGAAEAPVEPAQPAKKKRTLADLFNRNADAAPAQSADVATAEPAPSAPATPAKKIPAVAPEQQASLGGGGFVVQLANFASRAEAQQKYAQLKAKNAGALGRYSPIISEVQSGGSTRYRLSAGTMGSKAQADQVCSSLFASGERDCLVKSR